MNKKWTIIAITALSLMLAGIAFAVTRLYRQDSSGKPARQDLPAEWALLRAVPSDAVMVFRFDGSRHARRVVADSTGVLQAFLAPDNRPFMDFLSLCAASPTVVSVHNSGSLFPLVVTGFSATDSLGRAACEDAARKAGLRTEFRDGLLLASRSETFINASIRHLNGQMSVLDAPGLRDLVSRVSGSAVILASNQQAGKLLQVFSTARLRRHTSFVRDLSAWTAFRIEAADADHIVLKGTAVPSEDAGSFFKAFRGAPAPQASFAEALPYYTDYAVSLPVDRPEPYLARVRDYKDSRGQGPRYDRSISARGGRNLSPEEWARDIQLREAVKAAFQQDGVPYEVLLVRTGRDLRYGRETANPYPGALEALFGETFAVTDTTAASLNGRWSVFGDTPAVRLFADKGFLSYSLKDRLSDAGIDLPSGFVTYGSLSDAPSLLTDCFAAGPAGALGRYVTGSAYAPAVTSLDLSSGTAEFSVALEKRALKGSKVQVLERDTTVVIPTGLFPVQNYVTGQTNYLYQNANLYICLNDENGKGVWGIPFKNPICGVVESIDYYNNGKIQFLFASDSRIWLLDRTGKFVGGFPVDLGKPVLLGPAAYDFTGAHGYNIMVLHKDNTLEMYNLHGVKPQDWKGISAPETVKSLPELVEVKGKHYWAVRTSIRTLIYGFYGGEPLTRDEGGKMIRPDSQLTPTSKGVTVDCYDGKTRDIRLN